MIRFVCNPIDTLNCRGKLQRFFAARRMTTPPPRRHPDVETPIPSSALAEQELVLEWLGRATRRIETRTRLQEGGWVVCTVLSALGLYLLFQNLGPPGAVLRALSALLLVGAGSAVAFFGWRWTHRASLSAAAGEADARADLKDELKSAYWFACQDTASAPQALMLSHAAQTVRRLDPREIFPLRMPGNFSAAAALGAIALALALAGPVATRHTGSGVALAGDMEAEAGSASRDRNADDHAGFRFGSAPESSASPKAQEQDALWTKAEELARSLNSAEARAELQRAIRARDVKRVRELLEPAEQAGPTALAGPDARAQAGQVSAEVAQAILERLESLLGQGEKPEHENQAQTASEHEPGLPARSDGGAQESQRRDAEQHTTMDALNDALRALSQAATGDRPMANSPGQASQNNGRTNINGGAMGMRVNTSQAGPGGDDTPPEGPSEGAGEPVLGKPTLRLAAQLQRLGTGAAQNDPGSGTSEGFYAATQAQAARLDFAPAEVPSRTSDEAVLTREQVPIAYRASVKRYFLTEHRKEH